MREKIRRTNIISYTISLDRAIKLCLERLWYGTRTEELSNKEEKSTTTKHKTSSIFVARSQTKETHSISTSVRILEIHVMNYIVQPTKIWNWICTFKFVAQTIKFACGLPRPIISRFQSSKKTSIDEFHAVQNRPPTFSELQNCETFGRVFIPCGSHLYSRERRRPFDKWKKEFPLSYATHVLHT